MVDRKAHELKDALHAMVLDGEYTHSLAIQAELRNLLGARVSSVASSPRAPGHLSRHTDNRLTTPHSDNPHYAEALLDLIVRHTPDVVVPVGFPSFSTMVSLADALPSFVHALVPGTDVFHLAANKTCTYEAAVSAGVRAPSEYPIVLESGDSIPPESEFPIFAKARRERGGVSTALIGSPAELMDFDVSHLGGDVIFQEFISGDQSTYAQCGYYADGKPVVTFQHQELRSAPRRGGSGTRVKAVENRSVAEAADRLLRELKWDGIAQVEFKRNRKGEYVIMEINPKFWASYALAARSGYPIAATAVAHRLGLSVPDSRPCPGHGLSMVFPLRELKYVAKNLRTERILESVAAMVWPPAIPDVELLDLRAHIPRRSR